MQRMQTAYGRDFNEHLTLSYLRSYRMRDAAFQRMSTIIIMYVCLLLTTGKSKWQTFKSMHHNIEVVTNC